MVNIIDLEATTKEPGRGDILTLYVIQADTKLNITNKKLFTFKPEFLTKWESEAEKVHGITKQNAIQFQDRKDSFIQFLDFCGKDSIFYCHAYPIYGALDLYDYQYCLHYAWFYGLVSRFENVFPESLVRTAQRKDKGFQRQLGLKSQKLNHWAEFLNFKLDHHNPESDALCLLEIIKYQIQSRYIDDQFQWI